MVSKLFLQSKSMMTTGMSVRESIDEKPSRSKSFFTSDLPLNPRASNVSSNSRIMLKPWDKSDVGDDKHKLRVPLLTSNVYVHEHSMKVMVPPRVLVRLERLLHTDRVLLHNSKFLDNISKKIEEEDAHSWKVRLKTRRNNELSRHRYLLINGLLDIGSEPHERERMTHHPMYRVNQAIKRIKKYDDNPMPTNQPSPMSALEPFAEYERTGRLFYNHPEHHLKTTPLKSLVTKEGSVTSIFDNQSQLQVSKNAEDELLEEKNDDDDEELEEEEIHQWNRIFENFVMRKALKIEKSHKLESLIRRGSMTAVKRILGLNASELDKRWSKEKSSLLDVLYKPDMEKSGYLYSSAKEISNAYKRENKITDHFCNTQQRMMFAKPI